MRLEDFLLPTMNNSWINELMVTLDISLNVQVVGVVALSDQDQQDGTTPTLSLNIQRNLNLINYCES